MELDPIKIHQVTRLVDTRRECGDSGEGDGSDWATLIALHLQPENHFIEESVCLKQSTQLR